MSRRLVVVGLSHKTAPVEVRERAAFPEAALPPALREAVTVPGVGEAMIVSTCNRVELYAGVEGSDGVDKVRRFFCHYTDGQRRAADLQEHTYAHDGEEAVRHLFSVAASLDSMVVGESQILGQVKDAFQVAQETGTAGPTLLRTLPRAFQVAKRVRNETEVARNSASVASVAVDLAARIFGSLQKRQVLVVGAGKMGDLAARHLQTGGARELLVVNRTLSRAEEVAKRLGGKAIPWEELDRALEKVDVVVCSTGAAQPVIQRDRVARAMKARKGRWLFFIDIAVPRDVEPAVGEVENVYLYDVDALEEVVAQNLASRGREADVARGIVEEELARYREAESALGVVPTIKLLRERFLEVARGEVHKMLPKLGALGEKEQKLVEHMAEAIVNKLLHTPMTLLKKEAKERPDSDALAATVRQLFELHTGHTQPIDLFPEGVPDAPKAQDQAQDPQRRTGSGEGGR